MSSFLAGMGRKELYGMNSGNSYVEHGNNSVTRRYLLPFNGLFWVLSTFISFNH